MKYIKEEVYFFSELDSKVQNSIINTLLHFEARRFSKHDYYKSEFKCKKHIFQFNSEIIAFIKRILKTTECSIELSGEEAVLLLEQVRKEWHRQMNSQEIEYTYEDDDTINRFDNIIAKLQETTKENGYKVYSSSLKREQDKTKLWNQLTNNINDVYSSKGKLVNTKWFHDNK